MFEWDMSEAALNSYEQDAEDIHTTARILRLIKQVRDHRKEIERQRALIERADSLICHLRYMADKEGSLIKKVDEWLKDASGERGEG